MRAYIYPFSLVSRVLDNPELTFTLCNTKFRVMAEKEEVSTEVPSYFIGSLMSSLGNLATNAGSAIANGAGHLASAASNIPVVGNVLKGGITSLGNGIGQVVSGNLGGGLNSMYLGADKLLGGILPGGQAFGAGYLGNLYGSADRALGGYLPNIGGVGVTPAQMSGAALNAAPGSVPGGVAVDGAGNGFGGVAVDAPGAVPGAVPAVPQMSNMDKLAMGLQGAGLLGSIFSGNKGTAQAAMMYPGMLQPGAGRSQSPLAQTIKQDPVMEPVGGGSATGQDKNKTPGLIGIGAGLNEDGTPKSAAQLITDDVTKAVDDYLRGANTPMEEVEEKSPLAPRNRGRYTNRKQNANRQKASRTKTRRTG